MCDVREEYVDLMRNDPNIRGKSLSQLFPQYFMANMPYQNIKVGCCIMDGRPMSHHEMEPPKKSPRAICSDCYSKWTSQVTEICPICGEALPIKRVEVQADDPYEVALRIHDGKCLEYFSLLSCKALGDDMSFIAEETGYQPPQQYKQQYQPPQEYQPPTKQPTHRPTQQPAHQPHHQEPVYPQPTYSEPRIEDQKAILFNLIKALEAKMDANIGNKDITRTKLKVLISEYESLEGQQPDFIDAEYYESAPGQLTSGQRSLPQPIDRIVPSENMPFQPDLIKVKVRREKSK
jgi:hypothetical protein